MKLIVFDIDDTLTKSEDQHQLAYVNTMKHYGINTIDQNWSKYEHHTDSFILKENYENNLPNKFDFSFIHDFEDEMSLRLLGLQTVKEILGASSIIRELLGNPDYAIAYATGSLLKPALIKLDQANIEFQEELVVGSNKIFEREGIVSEAIERAKEYHKIESFESIISVGDGIWDLNAAKNLGLHFIGIGMKNFDDFEKAKIKMHIMDWSEFDISVAERLFQ